MRAIPRLRPKGPLIEHLGVYSLSVLILYEESLTRMRVKKSTGIFRILEFS